MAASFLWAGIVLYVVAAIGLLRMPDLYTRMQASAKTTTLGIALMMIGVATHYGTAGVILRAAGVIALFFITAPIAAQTIARAAYFNGVKPWHGSAADDEAATDELQLHRGEGDAEG